MRSPNGNANGKPDDGRRSMRGYLAALIVFLAVLVGRPASAEPVVVLVSLADQTPHSFFVVEDVTKVGSGFGDDVKLNGLDRRHFVLRNYEGRLLVLARGRLRMGRRARRGTFEWTKGTLRAGKYRFVLSGSAHEPAPTPLEDTKPEGESATSQLKEMFPESGVVDDNAPDVDAFRREEFGKEAYRFCHDPEFGKGVVGVDLCVLLDEETADACPEAFKTCPGWTPPKSRQKRSDGKGKEGRGARMAPKDRRMFSLPTLPAPVAWMIVLAGLAVVIFLFARAVLKADWESDDLELDAVELSDDARKLQALPETRCQVLLRMAERELAQEKYEEAGILLHLAILRYLDDEGLARYHPSKTNGDYLRAIRRYSPLAKLFKGAARQTERVRFGDGQVDVAELRALLSLAEPELNLKAGDRDNAVARVSTALLLLAVLPTSTGCGDERDRALQAHDPAGMVALPGLLQRAGLTVEISRSRIDAPPVDTSVVVIRTGAARRLSILSALRLDTLLDRDISVVVIDDFGTRGLFMPGEDIRERPKPAKAMTLELREPSTWSSCLSVVQGAMVGLGQDGLIVPKGRRMMWDGTSRTATVSKHRLDLTPFLFYAGLPSKIKEQTVAHAWVVERAADSEPLNGCLYVFADRDVFTNASLTRSANAQFVVTFFRQLITESHPKIVFMDRLDAWSVGSSDDGEAEKPEPTRALEASNMLPFILQGMLTLILVYVFLGAAFGPLRDPAESEHKAFSEHVEALGRQYARTQKPGLTHSATVLARLLVHRYRDRLRGGAGGGWSALAQDLARKYNLNESDVRAALRLGIEGKSELGAPTPEDPEPSSESMLRTLTHLLSGRQAPDQKPGGS